MLLTDPSDTRELADLGYRQELRRALGSFSAFAAGFSYLSILTGVFQMFHIGFTRGGPAFIWTWPIVLGGQALVALCFAELAAQFPLSGGVYQWSKRIGSGAAGWMAGWVYLASLVISISAVALALQVTLPEISPWFQVIGDASNESDAAKNAVFLGCALIAFTTLVNSIGVGIISKINNLGVFAELLGSTLLIVLLAAHARRSPEIAIDRKGIGGAGLWGYLGPFFAAALVSHYVLYGFDTAGCLAEETVHPRKRAPRAILQALAAAGAAGFLLMFVALLSAKRFDTVGVTGLPGLVKDVLGETLGSVFLIDVVFAIIVWRSPSIPLPSDSSSPWPEIIACRSRRRWPPSPRSPRRRWLPRFSSVWGRRAFLSSTPAFPGSSILSCRLQYFGRISRTSSSRGHFLCEG